MTPAMTNSLRLLTGLVQGIVLFLLYKAVEHSTWPATDPTVFACLLTIAVVVPLLKIINIGNMRFKTMAVWLMGLTVILVVLVMHNVHRRGDMTPAVFMQYLPSLPFIFFVSAGVFIAQCLIAAGDAERNYIASYPRYFDVAWKLAIQLNFAISFVAAFWGIVFTGSAMLAIVKVAFVRDLIHHSWFDIPVTTLALAYALHLTDVHPGIVRGIRTMKLTLLSWLLPLIVFFVTLFLISIPTAGMALLWATHHTSQIMLCAAAWLVLLINAAYQDGAAEHRPVAILRWAGRLGSIILLPLVAIAGWALSLRVGQYGWTVNLVEVAACIFVASCYAVGYVVAAFSPGEWLRRLEHTNIYTSFVIIALLMALFTPIADPARIAVADQMARLKDGRVTADKFDYAYLSRQGGIYGAEALKRLKDEAKDPADKQRIDTAILVGGNKFMADNTPAQTPVTPEDLAANLTVYPAGAALPATFTAQDWRKDNEAPTCLRNKTSKCEAYIIDKGKDVSPEIIVTYAKDIGAASLYRFENNNWVHAGRFSYEIGCVGNREAMRAGNFKLVPSTDEELEVNGARIQIMHDVKPCLPSPMGGIKPAAPAVPSGTSVPAAPK